MTSPEPIEEPGRRSLLAMLLVFGALTVLVVGASLVARVARPSHGPGGWSSAGQGLGTSGPQAQDPRVTAFLGPIVEGASVGDYTVVIIEPVRQGRLTISLADREGMRTTIEVYARAADGFRPMTETEHFALFIRSAPGSTTTPSAAAACLALGDALRAREQATNELPALDANRLPTNPPSGQ
ncbi:MAG: hypothetical protein U0271_24365 [Polyangiaceae bacterium]